MTDNIIYISTASLIEEYKKILDTKYIKSLIFTTFSLDSIKYECHFDSDDNHIYRIDIYSGNIRYIFMVYSHDYRNFEYGLQIYCLYKDEYQMLRDILINCSTNHYTNDISTFNGYLYTLCKFIKEKIRDKKDEENKKMSVPRTKLNKAVSYCAGNNNYKHFKDLSVNDICSAIDKFTEKEINDIEAIFNKALDNHKPKVKKNEISLNVFVSQPMNGLSIDEIEAKRTTLVWKFKKYLALKDPETEYNINVLDNLQLDAPEDYTSLDYISNDVKTIKEADFILFAHGFTDARGCLVEELVWYSYKNNPKDMDQEKQDTFKFIIKHIGLNKLTEALIDDYLKYNSNNCDSKE